MATLKIKLKIDCNSTTLRVLRLATATSEVCAATATVDKKYKNPNNLANPHWESSKGAVIHMCIMDGKYGADKAPRTKDGAKGK